MLFGRLLRGTNDAINSTLKEINFLSIKDNQLTISEKEAGEHFKRNLAQLKAYSEADYLKGVIRDASELADAYAQQ